MGLDSRNQVHNEINFPSLSLSRGSHLSHREVMATIFAKHFEVSGDFLMKRLLLAGAVLAAFLSGSAHAQGPDNILNASYDISRELFDQINEAFIAKNPGK